MKTEQEILDAIKKTEVELKNARIKLDEHRMAWLHAETEVIGCKISLERLTEELRVHRKTTVRHEKSILEKDTDAFREKLPELLKKI